MGQTIEWALSWHSTTPLALIYSSSRYSTFVKGAYSVKIWFKNSTMGYRKRAQNLEFHKCYRSVLHMCYLRIFLVSLPWQAKGPDKKSIMGSRKRAQNFCCLSVRDKKPHWENKTKTNTLSFLSYELEHTKQTNNNNKTKTMYCCLTLCASGLINFTNLISQLFFLAKSKTVK